MTERATVILHTNMFIVLHWLLKEKSLASEVYFSHETERDVGIDPKLVSSEKNSNCIPSDFPFLTVVAVFPKTCITMKMRQTMTRKTRKRRKRKLTDQVSGAWINNQSK